MRPNINYQMPVGISTDDTNPVISIPVDVPVDNIGKSHRYFKNKASDPSLSIDEVNIPEVSGLNLNFTYNFYVDDERVNYPLTSDSTPLTKLPRYISIGWTSPINSDFLSSISPVNRQNSDFLSIQNNKEKIVSEDNFFNPGYINHTFSNIEAIEQGSSDLENFSRMSQFDAESVYKMSKYQMQDASSNGDVSDANFINHLKDLSDSYEKLSNIPKTSLGLSAYNEQGNINDDGFLRSITDSLTLSIKLNSAVIPDIFKDSSEKTIRSNLEYFKVAYAQSQTGGNQASGISPIRNECSNKLARNLMHPVDLIGYIVERYEASSEGFKKNSSFYIEDMQKTQLVDKNVLYGKTYVYSVRVIASVKLMTYDPTGTIVDISTIYVGSRPITTAIESYEHVPPPEPNDIKFIFDYIKRNLRIHWDTPVNPQRDIKQFQVFRRKNIKEPFELIAQYGFDTSKYGPGDTRYKTGERVDANNFVNMDHEDKKIVYEQDSRDSSSRPVNMHVDEDFAVDDEFFVSSDYIYAICSVDAHGMISNYSSQHHVVFDSYKNKLVSKIVCNAGAPKQYPNMTLKTDAFKDVINFSGSNCRKLKVYFTPEYLKVRDDSNMNYKIVEAQNLNNNSYYLLQLINLDNQKMQLLKINVKDPKNLTV